ncbi:MAG: rhamnogalacturonan acetylesterase [Tepidisphaeraceae bacterium]|jgi:lysophospholipase L1-like esterase
MSPQRPLHQRFAVALAGVLLLLPALALADTTPQTSFKFQFAPAPTADGYIQVAPTDVYSKDRGWGFEPGPNIQAVSRGGTDPLTSGFVTSDKPFYFSVALPEGNYQVKLTLGDPDGESTTTVKAELRRLMLHGVHTDRGRFATPTIIVNIRTPQISTGGQVKLKGRETTTEAWAWDEKMTLEFNDTHPCLTAMEISPANVPTLFILGDSTVCDQPLEPWNSWGQMLTVFFKPEIAVANHAESGESLRSSLGARRLDKVISLMKPGDYLMIQYGHNDQKERGPGVGAFTTYTADLEHFVDAARAVGGTPIVITSMNRKNFDADGKVVNTLGDYPEAVRRVAKAKNVPLIDLNAMSKTFYEALGPANIGPVFMDGTHQRAYGSYELARCIVQGIKDDKLDLAKYLVDDLPDFDPAHPDPVSAINIPASPMSSTTRPLGN